MITINSTDEERVQILENKTLTIVPWDEKKEMLLSDPDMSIRKALIEHAHAMGVMGVSLKMEGMETQPLFSRKSLDESLYRMVQCQGKIQDLAKLFTVLKEVSENAVLIEVEEYRHKKRQIAKQIGEMRQYITAFCDNDRVYPVKITVEQKIVKKEARVYMIVSVGRLDLKKVLENQKEALPSARGTFDRQIVADESLRSGTASFNVSLARFIKLFKRKEEILLKHFPDAMLTDQQKQMKELLKLKDMRKEEGPIRFNMKRQL